MENESSRPSKYDMGRHVESLKNSWRKPPKPKIAPPRKKLRLQGVSDVSIVKREIQALVRDIVIKRDGGCVLRKIYGIPRCNGYAPSDGHLILQADHLITRANSATYADTRLIVCLCQGHHGWKKWHKEQYDDVVRRAIGEERTRLWERAQLESWRAVRTGAHDWQMHKMALIQELSTVRAYVEPLAI